MESVEIIDDGYPFSSLSAYDCHLSRLRYIDAQFVECSSSVGISQVVRWFNEGKFVHIGLMVDPILHYCAPEMIWVYLLSLFQQRKYEDAISVFDRAFMYEVDILDTPKCQFLLADCYYRGKADVERCKRIMVENVLHWTESTNEQTFFVIAMDYIWCLHLISENIFFKLLDPLPEGDRALLFLRSHIKFSIEWLVPLPDANEQHKGLITIADAENVEQKPIYEGRASFERVCMNVYQCRPDTGYFFSEKAIDLLWDEEIAISACLFALKTHNKVLMERIHCAISNIFDFKSMTDFAPDFCFFAHAIYNFLCEKQPDIEKIASLLVKVSYRNIISAVLCVSYISTCGNIMDKALAALRLSVRLYPHADTVKLAYLRIMEVYDKKVTTLFTLASGLPEEHETQPWPSGLLHAQVGLVLCSNNRYNDAFYSIHSAMFTEDKRELYQIEKYYMGSVLLLSLIYSKEKDSQSILMETYMEIALDIAKEVFESKNTAYNGWLYAKVLYYSGQLEKAISIMQGSTESDLSREQMKFLKDIMAETLLNKRA
ncbi:hypothetical protein PCE1_002997 [Barthelona sp. PCE]